MPTLAVLLALCALLAVRHARRRSAAMLRAKIEKDFAAGDFSCFENFSPADLKKFTGRGGTRALVAHKGKVYDVTDAKMWEGGVHLFRHSAGYDLTSAIKSAPHTAAKLDDVPTVGTYDPGLITSGCESIRELSKIDKSLAILTASIAALAFVLLLMVVLRIFLSA